MADYVAKGYMKKCFVPVRLCLTFSSCATAGCIISCCTLHPTPPQVCARPSRYNPQADTLFKPRAMREAEEAARASSLGPIRVRLHFPDATIIQATFSASQPLSAVQQLVTQIALEAVAPALYLYTTPPKTVLKDLTATLYQLQLVPAAHLYVGCEPEKLKAQAAAAVAGEPYPAHARAAARRAGVWDE